MSRFKKCRRGKEYLSPLNTQIKSKRKLLKKKNKINEVRENLPKLPDKFLRIICGQIYRNVFLVLHAFHVRCDASNISHVGDGL